MLLKTKLQNYKELTGAKWEIITMICWNGLLKGICGMMIIGVINS